MKIRYNPEFKELSKKSFYPIVGFYYTYLTQDTSAKLTSGSVTTVDFLQTTKLLIDNSFEKTAFRVVPCIRLGEEHLINLQRNKEVTDKKFRFVLLLYFDLIESKPISNYLSLKTEDLKGLKVAAILSPTNKNGTEIADIEDELLLDYSNMISLGNFIQCDFRRLVDNDMEHIEHLDGYYVDKRTATNRFITDNQFVEKDSGLDFAGEKMSSKEKNYNTFMLNPSGMIDI